MVGTCLSEMTQSVAELYIAKMQGVTCTGLLILCVCCCVQVNDEGYTPLMEAAREGHEEMVALLLAQGK